jgi:hypothetical protein
MTGKISLGYSADHIKPRMSCRAQNPSLQLLGLVLRTVWKEKKAYLRTKKVKSVEHSVQVRTAQSTPSCRGCSSFPLHWTQRGLAPASAMALVGGNDGETRAALSPSVISKFPKGKIYSKRGWGKDGIGHTSWGRRQAGGVAHEALGAHAAQALLAVEAAPEEVKHSATVVAVAPVQCLVLGPEVRGPEPVGRAVRPQLLFGAGRALHGGQTVCGRRVCLSASMAISHHWVSINCGTRIYDMETC